MMRTVRHLVDRIRSFDGEGGFLAGRLALVIFIIGLIVVAAVIAFLIPGG
jgi:hypothetical protein